MERLTNKKLKIACDYFVNFASKEEAVKYRMLAESAPKYEEIYRKLADYEDKQEQGLLIELPCKVGDVVYHERPYVTLYTGIQAYQITNIMISQNKKGEWTKKYRAMLLLNGKIVDSQINFSFDAIGKTVFLTRSEAESALAKMGGSHE